MSPDICPVLMFAVCCLILNECQTWAPATALQEDLDLQLSSQRYQLTAITPRVFRIQGDGEKSPRQRRPSSPSSNSSLGGYGRYTPTRSPQNYSQQGTFLLLECSLKGEHKLISSVTSATHSDVTCRMIQSVHQSATVQPCSFPPPLTLTGAFKYPPSGARDSSSLPLYSPGGADGSGGKYWPAPAVGSAGLSYHLNPTTLTMLQQHNYIPYFRGIRAHRDPALVQY